MGNTGGRAGLEGHAGTGLFKFQITIKHPTETSCRQIANSRISGRDEGWIYKFGKYQCVDATESHRVG